MFGNSLATKRGMGISYKSETRKKQNFKVEIWKRIELGAPIYYQNSKSCFCMVR